MISEPTHADVLVERQRRRALTKSTPKPGNSLAERFPEKAAEWHPAKNGSVSPSLVNYGAKAVAWWLCAAGHEWRSQISYRTRENGSCRRCRYVFVADVPELILEWDWDRNQHLDPTEVIATGGTPVAWVCRSCGYEWKIAVVRRTTFTEGCIKCSAAARGLLRRQPLPGRSFEEVHPHLAPLWNFERNGVSAREVNANSADSMHFTCPKGHEVRVRLYTCADGAIPCRKCSMAGTSLWELSCRASLSSIGIPVVPGTMRFPSRSKGHTWRPDVVVAEWKLLIEFDGYFWHKKSEQRDRARDAAFRDMGWTTVRLRADLPQLNSHDVVVADRNPSVATTVAALLVRLREMGYLDRLPTSPS